jgi:hypothetical protein
MSWKRGVKRPDDFPTQGRVESNERTAVKECAKEIYAECEARTCQVCKIADMLGNPLLPPLRAPGLDHAMQTLLEHYRLDKVKPSCHDPSGVRRPWANLHLSLQATPPKRPQPTIEDTPATRSTALLNARWAAAPDRPLPPMLQGLLVRFLS